MNLDMIKAYIEGYQDRLYDQQCIAVQQGYWAGYYQSKKPKPVNVILKSMDRDRARQKRQRNNAGKNVSKPAVDMERFMEREQRRFEYLASRKRK